MSSIFHPPSTTIHTGSLEAIGPEMASTALGMGSFASAFNPVTSTAYFIPLWLSNPVSITKVFAANGATAQGSLDVGLYDEDGGYIISSGSTTQSGANGTQEMTLSPNVIIGPGQFYLAVSLNTTQGTLLRVLWTTTTLGTLAGMKYLYDTFPLPTTAVTFTNLTNTAAALPFRALTYIPLIGFTTNVTGP